MILLRERDAPAADPCAFEVFLVKRRHASGFMGGAYVFPGGKLDEAPSPRSTRRIPEPTVSPFPVRRWPITHAPVLVRRST